MKTSAKTKLVESLLVIAGFGAWMAIGIAYEDRVEASFDFSYLVGTLIFFVIAFFIPERPRGSFISRSQVIGVAALLLWIGLNQLFKFGEPSLRDQFESTAGSLSFGISSIVAPFIFYWGQHFSFADSMPTQHIKQTKKQNKPALDNPLPVPS